MKIRQAIPNLVKIGQKISVAIYEDLRTLYSCRRRKFATKASLCNNQYSQIVNSDTVAFTLQQLLRERAIFFGLYKEAKVYRHSSSLKKLVL